MTFPISEATPIRFPGPPPARTEVVVLGGGVVGVMTAWHLAERGLKVVLCEKGRIAGEQSSRNWGWVRQQGRDAAELPIMVEAQRIWASLAQEFGDAIGYQRTGVMYLANTEADLAGFESWLPEAKAQGVDTRMLSRVEVARMIPQARADWPGAMFTASDARAEPWAAVPILAMGAVRRGAVIIENCAVRGLDISAGRITGVVTEQGRIGCEQVVVAGGAWSSLFLAAHGVKIPQLAVLASVAASEPLPEVFAGAACDNHFAFRRRADGGYTLAPGAEHDFFIGPDALRNFGFYLPVLKKDFRSTHFRPAAPSGYPDGWTTPRRWAADETSPFERIRVLNPKPNRGTLDRVQDSFAAAFPQIGRPRLKAAWAGMIDTMPDVVPVIDRVAALPGLVIATGMSGHGFGIGPGIGRVVADLVADRPVGHDLHRFRLSRFSDGTKIAPGPAL